MKKPAKLLVQDNTLQVTGQIQFDTVMTLYQESESLISMMKEIVIDLKNLEHGDSSGLALCTAWMRMAEAQKKSLHFINMPLFMQDLIRVYGLDSVLPIQKMV